MESPWKSPRACARRVLLPIATMEGDNRAQVFLYLLAFHNII
jgi:hypothetical protein